ncbi:MAG TPA: TIGR03619 family F420-dependent LLM class oxidoreductase [Jatrophihabitantaceae bacterium]|jgi:probable F420-dependent oxidoreductase
MHIGIKIPNWGPLAGPDVLGATAVAAEARGFGSVWVSDHIALPRTPLAGYPYTETASPPFDPGTPFVEALLSLAHVAAVTCRVQLGTGVLVLPLRDPLLIAKQAASLDVLARGRLVLGVGAGWLEDEFRLLGKGFGDRGRRMDDTIRTMRSCWAGEEIEVAGTRVAVAVDPLPPRDPALPIVIGGHSPAALRRAATLGDAWYASNVTADEFGALVESLRALPGGAALAVGARPGVVAADDASDVVGSFRRAGADFVVLDGPFASVDVGGVLDWVHRTADALATEYLTEVAQPLVARASEG